MQIFGSPTLRRASFLLALGALLAIPSLAQPTITRGVDLFVTPADGTTAVDFSTNPIPAGFFCPGSAPFTGTVGLQGVPLATVPPGIAGSADTIVERVSAGVFSTSGTASIAVVLRALHLRSINDVAIFCPDEGTTLWRVDACACGLQPTTKLTVKVDPACGTCGTANGTLSLRVCLRFTRVDTGTTAGPIPQNLTLNINNMSWCYLPGTSATVVNEPFGVDTNCDGQPDLTLPPTSNFHPGWSCPTQAGDCWVLFAHLTHCHPNPAGGHDHCINPVCGKRTN